MSAAEKRRGFVDVLKPIGITAFKEPVEEGHLRLRGLSLATKQVTIFAVVALAALLLSVLFAERWRGSELLFLDSVAGRPEFLPEAIMPITLVCLALAWWVLTWGALHAAIWVRVLTAVLFLVTNATLGRAAAFAAEDTLALTLGPNIIRVAYFTVPALMVLSCFVPRARYDRARWIFMTLTAVGTALVFLTHLWVHLGFTDAGFDAQTAGLVTGAIRDVRGLLTPLIFATGLLVVDFSLDVASGVALSGRAMAAKVVKFLLVGIIIVKLAIQLWPLSEWIDYAGRRPLGVIRTLISALLFALAIAWIKRLKPVGDFERRKERLLYGSSVVLALPTLISMLVVSFGLFLTVQLGNETGYRLVRDFPTVGLFEWGRLVIALAAITTGTLLTHPRFSRKKTGDIDPKVTTERPETFQGKDEGGRFSFLTTGGEGSRQLGAGILLMGAWVLPAVIFDLAGWSIGFRDTLFDSFVTIIVAVWAGLRWKRMDPLEAVGLLAIVLFSWVVMTQGDWVTVLGQGFGLPEVVIFVVGTAFSLIADCKFTAYTSRSLPQAARAMLWVGFLLLSVTIFHWFTVTHAVDDSAQFADLGFFYLGIPLAAWLAAGRLLQREELEETAEEAGL